MVALLLFIAFGILFGYFATLNTSLVSVHFGTTTLESAPLYILVLVAFGIGVLFASIFYAIKALSTQFAFGKKDREVADAKREVTELSKTIHELELENARLKEKTGESEPDENSI